MINSITNEKARITALMPVLKEFHPEDYRSVPG